MPRLLLVADGDTARTAQLWIGDVEITTMTQRLTLDVDASGVTVCNLLLVPRDGFEVAIDARTIVAFVPLPGFTWTKSAEADGGWRVRCAQEVADA